jgi:hypothetical protein
MIRDENELFCCGCFDGKKLFSSKKLNKRKHWKNYKEKFTFSFQNKTTKKFEGYRYVQNITKSAFLGF